MDISKFKTSDEIREEAHKLRVENSKFTWEKASKLLSSWKQFIKEGCVDEEVYKHRRRICEGIPGKVAPCSHNTLKESTGQHFCGGCGCGQRELAVLYIEGKEVKDDHSIRLWMPTSNCPINAHQDSPGTKNFKPVGGRIKQIAKFAKASISEISRWTGTSSEEAVVFAQNEIEKNIDSDKEIESIVEYMEDDEQET